MKRSLTFIAILAISQILTAQTKSELQQRVLILVNEKMALQDEVNNLRTESLRLKEQILDLKMELATYKSENEKLRATMSSPQSGQPVNTQIQNLTSVPTSSPGRCQAITAKGTQCSRTADPGSNYCWQHKSTYEPSGSTKSSVSSSPSSSSSSSAGRTIYTGPRGGKYYINSKGNKVYIKQ